MSGVTISAENVRYEKGPVVSVQNVGGGTMWGHQRVMKKIIVVTCKQCGIRYRPK